MVRFHQFPSAIRCFCHVNRFNKMLCESKVIEALQLLGVEKKHLEAVADNLFENKMKQVT